MSAQTEREKFSQKCLSFPREARLLRPSEYQEVFRNGKKAADRAFACHVNRQEGAGSKLGIAVSRKVGNAVVRNRIKRQMREFFRVHRLLFRCEAQVVFVAYPGAAELSGAEIAKSLGQLLKGRGIL